MVPRHWSWPWVLLAVASPASAAFTNDPAVAADLQRGRKLGDDAARQREATLAQHPDDLTAHAELLGYYFDRAAAAPQRRLPHVLWMIHHRPADPLTPAYALVAPQPDPAGYAAAAAAWDAEVAAHPTDTAVLADAATFFDNGTDTAKAQQLLGTAMATEPKSADWPTRLAASTERQADRDPASAAALAGQALQLRQSAYKLAPTRAERFHVSIGMPADAYRSGDLIAAKHLATHLLETAEDFPNDPAHADAVHHAHTALGLVALHAGNADRAADELAAAATVTTSPGLAASGPDLSLARELLAHGERSPVRSYLLACQPIWPGGRERLASWVATLDAGGTPELK
jgi:hypothetical protein